MTRLYQGMYRSNAKYEAQDQLAGRTHYVDDSTLRFHHARIVNCNIAHDGLLFWLVESVALDMNNTKRGCRFVVFDIFGNVISHVSLDKCFKTSKAANKACREYLETVDAKKITKEALKKRIESDKKEYWYLTEQLNKISA